MCRKAVCSTLPPDESRDDPPDGKLGFPLDRMTAGKGFTLTLSGRSASNQDDVRLKKQETVTTGSVRIVFTPRVRTSA